MSVRHRAPATSPFEPPRDSLCFARQFLLCTTASSLLASHFSARQPLRDSFSTSQPPRASHFSTRQPPHYSFCFAR
ncbi:hypothetical protein WN943_004214 [Citrus x changshan-huyou]